MKAIFLIPCLVLFQAISIGQDRQSDSMALVAIYNSLDGPNWTAEYNDSWLSTQPLEEWEGVRTSNNRVSVLDITKNEAKGSFPLEILSLTELATLQLRENEINGEVPADLVQLQKLNRLILQSCQFSGDFPNIIKDLPLLNSIVLSSNEFVGSLPDLGKTLSLFYLQNNQFSGPIPDSWKDNSVGALQMQSNQLTGNFDLFSNWEDTRSMSLSDNNWDEQTLPIWIDDLINLTTFQCDNCNFVGDIPSEVDFSEHPKMDNMQLSHNDLSGDLTRLFTGETAERGLYLRVRFNNFGGEFPMHKLGKVSNMSLEGNQFSSFSTPDFIDLDRIDFKSNKFNFEKLMPVLSLIESDSIFFNYNRQSMLLDTVMLTLNSDTIVTLSAGDDANESEYTWFRGFTELENENNSTLTLNITDNSYNGEYYCLINNVNFPDLELRRHPVFINVNIPTSSNNLFFEDTQLFPNPASSTIHIQSEKELNGAAFIITNALGKVIIKGNLNNSRSIHIDDIEQGIHYIQLNLNGFQQGFSFVKL